MKGHIHGRATKKLYLRRDYVKLKTFEPNNYIHIPQWNKKPEQTHTWVVWYVYMYFKLAYIVVAIFSQAVAGFT